MSEDQQQSGEEAGRQLAAFVIGEIKAGSDKSAILAKLADMGVEGDEANQLVGSLYDDIMAAAQGEAFTSATLPLAIVGGAVAALVGGAVWGGIVIFSGYEIGFVAWGVGLLAGLAVVKASQGKKGTPLQVIAVLSSLAGILFGKYVIFNHFLKQYLQEEIGAEAAAEVPFLSATMASVFFESLPEMVGGFDLLWVALAVVTAWQIPKGMGIKAR